MVGCGRPYGQPVGVGPQCRRFVLRFGRRIGGRLRASGDRDRDGRLDHLPGVAERGCRHQADCRLRPHARCRTHKFQSGQCRADGPQRRRSRSFSRGANGRIGDPGACPRGAERPAYRRRLHAAHGAPGYGRALRRDSRQARRQRGHGPPRLPAGTDASGEQRRGHRDALRAFRRIGRLPPDQGPRWPAGPGGGDRAREAKRCERACALRPRAVRARRLAGRLRHARCTGRHGRATSHGPWAPACSRRWPMPTSSSVPTYAPAWKSDLVLGGHPKSSSGITVAAAIAGWPIATAPMGLVEGLPVGFGAVGRPGSEALLLAVCRAIEQPARPTWRQPGRG